jgi:hypothetical protein
MIVIQERINIKDLATEEPQRVGEFFFDPRTDISPKEYESFKAYLNSNLDMHQFTIGAGITMLLYPEVHTNKLYFRKENYFKFENHVWDRLAIEEFFFARHLYPEVKSLMFDDTKILNRTIEAINHKHVEPSQVFYANLLFPGISDEKMHKDLRAKILEDLTLAKDKKSYADLSSAAAMAKILSPDILSNYPITSIEFEEMKRVVHQSATESPDTFIKTTFFLAVIAAEKIDFSEKMPRFVLPKRTTLSQSENPLPAIRRF